MGRRPRERPQPHVLLLDRALAKNFDAPITDQLANVDLFFQPNFCQPVNFIGAAAMQAVAEQNASDAE